MKELLLALILLNVTCFQNLSTSARPEIQSEIDQLLKQYYQNQQFNGVVLVAQDGDVLFHKGYGYASIQEGVKNNSSTQFLIGSATKSFTAIAVLQCVDSGLLNLFKPINEYLPELNEEVGGLTLHQLMKNTSGLPVHLNRITTLEHRDISSEELLEIYQDIKLSFTPGSKYEYSNLNYQLCALIVEQVSGLSYSEYLQAYIFTPLKMYQSGVQRTHDTLAHRAVGYQVENAELIPAPKNYLSFAKGGGDIYANALDIFKWDQGLYEERILSAESKKLLFDGNPEEYGGYGYGFKIKPYTRSSGTEGKLVRHGGSMFGFVCNIHRYLEDRVTIIVLGNIRPYPAMEITSEIEKIIFNSL